jgi:hypothetical protein
MLKRKLTSLARVSTIDEEAVETTTNATDRLAKVVQTRLWSMLKRQLYDPSATQALHWSKKDDCEPKTDGTDFQREMLFHYPPVEDKDAEAGTFTDLLDYGEDDDNDPASEFDDLLRDDNAEDLDYWDQQRIEIERKTDEMLFSGNERNYEEYVPNPDPDEDIVLLHGTTREECMLV